MEKYTINFHTGSPILSFGRTFSAKNRQAAEREAQRIWDEVSEASSRVCYLELIHLKRMKWKPQKKRSRKKG